MGGDACFAMSEIRVKISDFRFIFDLFHTKNFLYTFTRYDIGVILVISSPIEFASPSLVDISNLDKGSNFGYKSLIYKLVKI